MTRDAERGGLRPVQAVQDQGDGRQAARDGGRPRLRRDDLRGEDEGPARRRGLRTARPQGGQARARGTLQAAGRLRGGRVLPQGAQAQQGPGAQMGRVRLGRGQGGDGHHLQDRMRQELPLAGARQRRLQEAHPHAIREARRPVRRAQPRQGQRRRQLLREDGRLQARAAAHRGRLHDHAGRHAERHRPLRGHGGARGQGCHAHSLAAGAQRVVPAHRGGADGRLDSQPHRHRGALRGPGWAEHARVLRQAKTRSVAVPDKADCRYHP